MQTNPTQRMQQVAVHLLAARFNFTNEAELQEGLAEHLHDFAPGREVELNATDRIDFLLDGIGIEVKVQGSRAAVLRQLHRYAQSPSVQGLILITCRARHSMPETLNDKPLLVVNLALQGAF